MLTSNTQSVMGFLFLLGITLVLFIFLKFLLIMEIIASSIINPVYQPIFLDVLLTILLCSTLLTPIVFILDINGNFPSSLNVFNKVSNKSL